MVVHALPCRGQLLAASAAAAAEKAMHMYIFFSARRWLDAKWAAPQASQAPCSSGKSYSLTWPQM